MTMQYNHHGERAIASLNTETRVQQEDGMQLASKSLDGITLRSSVNVIVQQRTECQTDDEVVTHFCFPTLGVAVPLRPGDFLMFNALIPHCISSRCKRSDEVIVLTMYLKQQ
jgi:hypothetical protein